MGTIPQEGALAELRRVAAAKDEMFSLLVHDLRNPLHAQIALLELVLNELGAGKSKVRRDVKAALRVTDELCDSLEDLLQVRLLEEGGLPMRRERVKLRAILGRAVGRLDAIARKRRIHLSTRIDGGEVAFLDSKLVRRSVENLLANALRYTPSGGDVVVLGRLGAQKVDIEVADRGPGVPDDLKGSLFEKFGSLESRRGRPRAGFGLGLHLVKLVAESHGGAVSVQDRPGGGSVFGLHLPARVAP